MHRCARRASSTWRGFPRTKPATAPPRPPGSHRVRSTWSSPARHSTGSSRAGSARESLRILRPGGWGALIWNDRDLAGTPFLAGYEALLLEYGNDYQAIRYRHQGTDAIPVYFGGQPPVAWEWRHRRDMDWAMLAALAGSASYLPAPGQARHAELMVALRALFDSNAAGGRVELRYTCRVHAAPLS